MKNWVTRNGHGVQGYASTRGAIPVGSPRPESRRWFGTLKRYVLKAAQQVYDEDDQQNSAEAHSGAAAVAPAAVSVIPAAAGQQHDQDDQ